MFQISDWHVGAPQKAQHWSLYPITFPTYLSFRIDSHLYYRVIIFWSSGVWLNFLSILIILWLSSHLQDDEYVIYDVAQQRLCYIVEFALDGEIIMDVTPGAGEQEFIDPEEAENKTGRNM